MRTRHSNRTVMLIGSCLFLVPGCTEDPNAPASEYWALSDKADWGAVAPVKLEGAIDASSQLARFVDQMHKGDRQHVELFCDRYGRVFDRDNNFLQLTVESWQGVHHLIAQSPSESIAVRSMPAHLHDHHDGRGHLARWAYFCRTGPEHTLVFEVVKSLEAPSRG